MIEQTLTDLLVEVRALRGEVAELRNGSANTPLAMSAAEAGKMMGVSRRKVLQLFRDGDLNSCVPHGHPRFTRDAVLQFLKKQEDQ